MEGYFKRFFIAHFLIILIAYLCFYLGLSIQVVIIVVLLFELLIYILDRKYIPRRKTELANKLIEMFKAVHVSDDLMKFKMEAIEFYAEIEVDFKRSLQIADIETIRFHIPRNQINLLSAKPELKLKEGEVDGIQTYYVHQTNGMGLKFTKEKLKKMIKKVML